MFCSQCGSAISDGTKFCPSCGAPQASTAATPASPASPVSPVSPATPINPVASVGSAAPVDPAASVSEYAYTQGNQPFQPTPAPVGGPNFDPNYYNQQAQKKKSKLPLIIGIVVAVLVVAVIAGVLLCKDDSTTTPVSTGGSSAGTSTVAPVEEPAEISSANLVSNWKVEAVTNDGGDSFTDGLTNSNFQINADGTCALTLEGDTTQLNWSQDEYDGEGYFYNFTSGSSTLMVGYVYDEDPYTLMIMLVDDTDYALILTR